MSTHAPAHTPSATAHSSLATRAATRTPVPKLNTSFENTRLHLKTAAVSHHSSGSSGSILRTVVALVIVVAVIYGLTWIVRKLKGSKTTGPAAGDGLERIAQLPLGANKSVALVRVGSELHLLGLAEHSVTGIRSFSEDEAIELGLPISPPGSLFSMRGGAGTDAGIGDDDDAANGRPFGAMRATGGFTGTLDTLKRMTQR